MSIQDQSSSCVVCKKVFSHKGIHSHYITAHTEEGNDRVRKNAKIKHKPPHQTLAYNEKLELYNINPSRCMNCDGKLTYKQRKNKFCSHTCSAMTTSKHKILKPKHLRKKPPEKSIVHQMHCKCCNNLFWWSRSKSYKGKSSKYCSKICSKKSKSEWASNHFKKLKSGGVRPSKRILYKNVYLDSTYELKLAKILDEMSIIWEKPSCINYTKPGNKSSTYTADFYLPEYNLYLDPKNDFLINNINPGNKLKDIDKIAFVVEQHSISVAVIDIKNISHEFIELLVGHEGFEPSIILSCKNSGFDHSHQCPVIYL